MIALSLDSREEWDLAGLTLESFLNQLIAANGDKFWENQTQLTAWEMNEQTWKNKRSMGESGGYRGRPR